MSENLWLLAGMGVLVAFGSALLWLTTKMAKRLELALERSERRAEENRARALVPPQDALVRSLRRLEIMRGVWAERDRQDAKFGPQHHHWPRWIAIMGEEFGEVCKADLEGNEVDILNELEQLTAVCICALEHASADGLYVRREERRSAREGRDA